MAFLAIWQRFSGRRERLPALCLAAWAAVSCAFPAFAAPIGDGVSPLCDEAYYATTDYYGNLTDGSVVKSYQRNGAASLTDYGAYEQVTNLTDGSVPDWRGNAITFQFGSDAPERFYFEGKTSQPFRELPWTLSVHYALNGVPARAPDLAGQTGLVEITIDAAPNASASAYARNNYILAATAVFNQDDILSLEAPGAQLQLIGNLRTALFLAFPGEEGHFIIRVGSENFSFNGLTFLLVPATLSQLDEVAKLSEKKNDLEDSYHKLSDSLDTVLDSFSDMRDDLYATADGLETLNQARQTLSDGKNGVYGDLDTLRADLEALSAALEPLPRQARNASAFVTEAKTALNALIDTALRLRGTLTDGEGVLRDLENALAEMETGLAEVEGGLNDTLSALSGVETCLQNTETGLAAVEDGLRDTAEGLMRIEDGFNAASQGLEGVERGLSDTAENLEGVEGGLSDTAEGLEEVEKRISDTSGDLRQAETRLSDTENGLADVEDALDDLSDSLKGVESGLSSLSSGLKKVENGGGKLNDFLGAASDLSGAVTALRRALAQALAQIQETADSGVQSAAEFSAKDMLRQVETVGALFRHAENGPDPDEAAFFQAMLASQRPDLDADTVAQLSALFAMNQPEIIGAQDPEGTLALLETYQKLYYLYTQPDFEAFCAGILASRAQAAGQQPDMEEIQESARLMRRVWEIHENSGGDRAALELILDSMDTVTDNVGGVHEQTNRLLATLAVPANGVLADTSDFFDRMGRLESAVRDVLDLCQTLRAAGGSFENASKEARGLLDDLKETSGTLRDTLSALRQISGDLRGAFSALTDTSGDLRGTLSALIQTSASLRDTMGALADTSASLRDTISALTDTSGSLRDTLDALRDSSASLRGTLDALVSASASLRETGKRVVSLSGTLRKISAAARTGSETLRTASGIAKSALDDTDALRNVLNRYEPALRETLGTLETLAAAAEGTVRDSNRLIANTESLARSVGKQLDSGAEQTLSGLSSTVRKAAGSLDAAEDLRDAKNTITDLVEDTWEEYTGDTNNLLLMDSGAAVESLTSPSNPAPQSVQVLIRTQEIEKPKEAEGAEETAFDASGSPQKAVKSTFWGRLGQMFRDFWRSITGIFR